MSLIKKSLLYLALLAGIVLTFSLYNTFKFIKDDFIPKDTVWNYIKIKAPLYDLDPSFVFSLALAESNLNASAHNKEARGIMQIKKSTWYHCTHRPFSDAWDWKTNLHVAMVYLSHCKKNLLAANQFSYPHLAASYKLGPNYIQKINYNLQKLPYTSNKIYQKIFQNSPLPQDLLPSSF